MKSRTAVCAIMIAAMGLGSSSFAQSDRSNRQRPDAQRYEQRDDGSARDSRRQVQRSRQANRHDARNDARNDARHGRSEQWRQSERGRGYDRGRHGAGGYPRARGPVYYSYGARGPHFGPGVVVPGPYRNYNYVVNDWHAHHLHAPRRGQQWVQVGADYVLIAIATGVILQLVLSH